MWPVVYDGVSTIAGYIALRPGIALHVHTPRVEPTYYFLLDLLLAVLRSGRAWGWTQKRRRSSLLTSQWSRHFVRCALRTLACTIPSSSRPS